MKFMWIFLFLAIHSNGVSQEVKDWPTAWISISEVSKKNKNGLKLYYDKRTNSRMGQKYGILLKRVVPTDTPALLPHEYLVAEGTFNNGYKNGFWKTTHTGNKVKTENYDSGRLIGYYRVYNTNGELLYKTNFGPQGNGHYKDYYYKTGILKAKGRYQNGKKQGRWRYYDEQGNLEKTVMYRAGVPQQ